MMNPPTWTFEAALEPELDDAAAEPVAVPDGEPPEVALALESDEPELLALDPVLELPLEPVDEAPVDAGLDPLEAVELVSDESVVVAADESVV